MCVLCCSKVYPRRPIRRIIRNRNSTSIMCFLATFGIVLLVFVSSQHAQLIPENEYLTATEQQQTLDNRLTTPQITTQGEPFAPLVLDNFTITRNITSTPAQAGVGNSGPPSRDPAIDANARQTNAREEVSRIAIEDRSDKVSIEKDSIPREVLGQVRSLLEPISSDDGAQGKLEIRSLDNSIFNDERFLQTGTSFNEGDNLNSFSAQQPSNVEGFAHEGKSFNEGNNLNSFADPRPRNVSRQQSPHYPWGSHAFGPLEVYEITPHGLRWNAYFYEQTIAVVLEDHNRMVLNCSLLEVIPRHENRAALRSLGRVMALVPLNLRQMVMLTTFCESAEERLAPKPEVKRSMGEDGVAPERMLIHASTAMMGIMPGTVWCGLGDRASRYHQLGERRELDSCCRVHDHCPVKVRAGDTRYGFVNTGFSTVSHCLCDEAFRMCLQNASKFDSLVSMVGNMFFNILGSSCLGRPKRRKAPVAPVSDLMPPPENPELSRQKRLDMLKASQDDYYTPRLHCGVPDSDGGCRLWLRNPKNVPLKLELVRPHFKFEAPAEK